MARNKSDKVLGSGVFRALQAPGWRKEWHCGVRVVKSGRLVGFISAIPVTLNIYDKYVVCGCVDR